MMNVAKTIAGTAVDLCNSPEVDKNTKKNCLNGGGQNSIIILYWEGGKRLWIIYNNKYT